MRRGDVVREAVECGFWVTRVTRVTRLTWLTVDMVGMYAQPL